MASDDCLSASLIRWRGPRGTPRACALGAAARQAPDHAACVPAQRRTGGLGAQAAHTGRDAPADRAALAGGRAQEQGRSQDVPSARHPSVKRRRPDRTAISTLRRSAKTWQVRGYPQRAGWPALGPSGSRRTRKVVHSRRPHPIPRPSSTPHPACPTIDSE